MPAEKTSRDDVRSPRPVVLHVEDDLDLADVLQSAFERFGFRGTMLRCATAHEAIALLDARPQPIDLIVTDMRLPDGLGLDVVRHARRNGATRTTPILVLSSDLDPESVQRAYSLGANTFIAKAGSKRSILAVVRTLYDHWLVDARLPAQPKADRLQELLARFIGGRGRHADFFVRMANELCTEDEAELGFFFASALREANLANLLSFLRNVTAADLPPELLDELEGVEDEIGRDLDELERTMEQAPVASIEEAYRWALALEESVRVAPIAEGIAHLFPTTPIAMGALRDLIAGNLEAIAAWIEEHATDPASRDAAVKLGRQARALEHLIGALLASHPVTQDIASEHVLPS